MWKKLIEVLSIITLILVMLTIGLILSPIIIVSSINHQLKNKKLDKLYHDYLLQINGHKIFCYNNRKNSLAFIEQQIIPILPSDVKIIFLDGKVPKSADYSTKFSSALLYSIRHQVGFPYLLKIQESNVIEKSINNEMYNFLHQKHDVKLLFEAINNFYQ